MPRHRRKSCCKANHFLRKAKAQVERDYQLCITPRIGETKPRREKLRKIMSRFRRLNSETALMGHNSHIPRV